MKQFKGLFPAIVTPFYADGNCNYTMLEKLIEKNIAQGVSGFYVSGTTGESFLLSDEERSELIRETCSIVDGRCDVIANIGTFSTGRSIKMAKEAVRAGASAISAVPPFYFPYTKEEIRNYYLDIASEAETGIIIYNIPKMNGVNFATDDLIGLLNHENVVGIKQTTYDLYQTERLVGCCGDKTVFNGHDEILLPSLSVGVRAAIGSTFGIIPDVYMKLMQYFQDGCFDKAMELQKKANDLMDTLLKIGIFKAIKGILKLQGIDCGDCRKPFGAITREEYDVLDKALEKLYGG